MDDEHGLRRRVQARPQGLAVLRPQDQTGSRFSDHRQRRRVRGLQRPEVAASALYNEVVAAEVCEELGLATEPRTVTAGRRPVMEIAGVPQELIGWTAKRGEQIAACLTELEHEYVARSAIGRRCRGRLGPLRDRRRCG
ncbi:relaxase domain-containing protein [Streptomyces sp. NBC_01207]|uniref:relaxase domain-containing protein n=1 Tax=Streptomyces sp. NBC_01207 TaxID=2903772 RepID=UPI002E136E2F|nr:relaxase domain-containing protein [Streptomyces sp. NBC_01207]